MKTSSTIGESTSPSPLPGHFGSKVRQGTVPLYIEATREDAATALSLSLFPYLPLPPWHPAGWQVKPGTWNIHRTLGWARRDRTSICQPASILAMYPALEARMWYMCVCVDFRSHASYSGISRRIYMYNIYRIVVCMMYNMICIQMHATSLSPLVILAIIWKDEIDSSDECRFHVNLTALFSFFFSLIRHYLRGVMIVTEKRSVKSKFMYTSKLVFTQEFAWIKPFYIV